MKPILAILVLALSLVAAPAAAQVDGGELYSESYSKEARGDLSGALQTLEKLPNSKHDYVYHLRRGWLLYLNGRYDDSISSYDRAVKAAPRAVEPLLGRMLPEMALRRWKDTAATARKALSLDDDNYLATSRLAYSLYNLGRFDEAEKHYERLVTLYPSDVEMKAGLAWCLLKQGNKSKARALFEDVLKIAPSHASALDGLSQSRN